MIKKVKASRVEYNYELAVSNSQPCKKKKIIDRNTTIILIYLLLYSNYSCRMSTE